MPVASRFLNPGQNSYLEVGKGAFAVTPSDTVGNELTYVARALYIGGAGNVRLLTGNNETVTFVGLAAGSVLELEVRQVFSTSTTATNIVAIY